MRGWNILIALMSVVNCLNAQQFNCDTVGLKTLSDNIYNSSLFSDSLTSSFVLVIKKGVKTHKHISHSEHVIVLDGTGEMLLGTKTIELKKGDVVFIPKNTPHNVTTTSKIPLKVVSIQAPYFDGKDRVFID